MLGASIFINIIVAHQLKVQEQHPHRSIMTKVQSNPASHMQTTHPIPTHSTKLGSIEVCTAHIYALKLAEGVVELSRFGIAKSTFTPLIASTTL